MACTLLFNLHMASSGNFKGGRHFSEGGYDAIAVKLFNELNADTYYVRCTLFTPVTLINHSVARIRH